MTTLELKKLIREEAKKIIAENNLNLAEDSMKVALKRTIRESAKRSTTTESLKK